MALPRLRRAALIAGAAACLGVLAGAPPALAWWHGGVVIGVAPPPIYYPPPPIYYPPPAYYAPPPVVYAPPPPYAQSAPAGPACYAGPYACPLDHSMPLGAACYCLSNQRTQIWGHVR